MEREGPNLSQQKWGGMVLGAGKERKRECLSLCRLILDWDCPLLSCDQWAFTIAGSHDVLTVITRPCPSGRSLREDP